MLKWVPYEDVESIHDASILEGGGADGLRDESLLDSALARPRNMHAYGEADIFQLAACYAEAIAHNHPFIDGNKRTAFATACVFLKLNGYNLDTAKADEHADMMVALAQGRLARPEVAAHFRQYSTPIDASASIVPSAKSA